MSYLKLGMTHACVWGRVPCSPGLRPSNSRQVVVIMPEAGCTIPCMPTGHSL